MTAGWRPSSGLASLGHLLPASGAKGLVVAVAEGAITADDLLADWLVVTEGATLTIDAALVGALVWRLGASAYRRYLLGELDARAIDDGPFDLGARSKLALDIAAELLPRRGGDALERAAFALLFAAGEPQEGLAAFLEKRKARFGRMAE